MKLHFLGANRQVTGSAYLIELAGKRVLIDMGLFQEREFQSRNWDDVIDPASVDCMLLTHAHLDHCGRLPRLVKHGFNAPVYMTRPSADLARIVLEDAARLQEEDAAYKKRRHEKEGRRGKYPEVPLYTAEDAKQTFKLFQTVAYNTPVPLVPGVSAIFHEAGHILGSAMLEIICEHDGKTRRIVFSGDVGRWNKPLTRDPALLKSADYVVMESTYGDRSRPDNGDLEDELAQAINDTATRGGNILIPTFAIDRAQALQYHLGRLVRAKRIPRMLAFLDSPMAVNVSEVFARYPELLDAPTQEILRKGHDPLQFPGLQLSRYVEQSKAINRIHGTCIIMAGSGMCTGGRIKHHLVQNIGRTESTVIFVGYQSRNTLGRQIIDGAELVRIHGRMHRVKAKIVQVQGLSAHGDRDDLMRWLSHFESPPKRVFLTHGEESASLSLEKDIRKTLQWPTLVPEYGHVEVLD